VPCLVSGSGRRRVASATGRSGVILQGASTTTTSVDSRTAHGSPLTTPPRDAAATRPGRWWFWLRLAIVCGLVATLIGGAVHLIVRAAGTAIDEPALNESSGLVASHLNPGVFWSHNDSGRVAELFAFTADGQAVATLTMPGVRVRDWEDLAIGQDADGRAFGALYIGDIGDNGGGRDNVSVFRLPEPDLSTVVPGEPVALTVMDAERYELVYDDGPGDAETLMVDPRDGAILVVKKTMDETAPLYRADLPRDGTVTTLVRQSDVAIPGLLGLTRLATGGAISPSADRVVVRTYVAAWWWPVAPGQSIADAMTAIPSRLSLPAMRQGEAIAFSADGQTLYVTSEGSPALLGSIPAPAAPGSPDL